MLNYVKFKGRTGALYLDPELISGWGSTPITDSVRMEVAAQGSYILLPDKHTEIVLDSPTEIERKLKKYYERKNRTYRSNPFWKCYGWDGEKVGFMTSTSTDTPEKPVETQPAPIEKIMYPTSTEQNMPVAQTETMYTTDPNTPLPPGGKWVQTGCYLYGPYWVSPGHYQADRRSELWMAEIPLSQGPSL
jgi:hypothetical protein